MSGPNVSIVFVPGSFATPHLYSQVINGVAAQGHDIRALHLPSVGPGTGQAREGSLPTMYDDAAFIAKEVETLADQGKAVILVGHSYAGIPITQSVQGLSVKERQKQGKPGGIVRLAYMTAVVPAVGESATDVLLRLPEDQRLALDVDESGWMSQNDPAKTARTCFNHLSLDEGVHWVKQFPKHSSASFASPLTYPGYKDVPVSYLIHEEDRCITSDLQRAAIEMIEKESGAKVDVSSIKADHCSNISAPQLVVDWIVSVVEREKA
ncbi:hypothetical protein ABEF95_008733 [Exophiala dermatitidis]